MPSTTQRSPRRIGESSRQGASRFASLNVEIVESKAGEPGPGLGGSRSRGRDATSRSRPADLLRATSARVGSNSSTSLRFAPSIAHPSGNAVGVGRHRPFPTQFGPVGGVVSGFFATARRHMQRPVDRHLGQVKPDDPVIRIQGVIPSRNTLTVEFPPPWIHSSRRRLRPDNRLSRPSCLTTAAQDQASTDTVHVAPVTRSLGPGSLHTQLDTRLRLAPTQDLPHWIAPDLSATQAV